MINLSHYNVSRASLHDIETLWVKSGLVGEAWASSILAPMDVADRNSWLLRTLQLAPSFTKLLQNRTIRVANLNVLSHISCLILHFPFFILHFSFQPQADYRFPFFIFHFSFHRRFSYDNPPKATLRFTFSISHFSFTFELRSNVLRPRRLHSKFTVTYCCQDAYKF